MKKPKGRGDRGRDEFVWPYCEFVFSSFLFFFLISTGSFTVHFNMHILHLLYILYKSILHCNILSFCISHKCIIPLAHIQDSIQ